MENRKLGILLSTAPSNPNIETVIGLCTAALHKEIAVFLYLIDEGVHAVKDHRLVRLSDKGLKVYACAYGCQQHGIPTSTVHPAISLCGLVVLSNIVNACDRFLAFN